MIFNDDEPIPTKPENSASGHKVDDGVVTATLIHKQTAPLAQTDFNVMVSLTGKTTSTDRLPLDLVVVLDISGSMHGDKLKIMKTATEYLISKLGWTDRVSVVTFNQNAHRLCPLRQVTEKSQAEISQLVDHIHAHGSTNITDGLQMGLKVLNDRRYTDDNRFDAIMLMSDGEQNYGADATKVNVIDLPVYTFGFGTDQDPKVLHAIANNSDGGTFSDVQDVDHLSAAFAQCLAGLLVVVVQNLTLTVSSIKKVDSTINSTIKKVDAGNYKQVVDVVSDEDIDSDEDRVGGSVSISIGNLYSEEVRNVLVTLDLPRISKEATVYVLYVTYKDSSSQDDKVEEQPPILVKINRTANCSESEKEQVETEKARNYFTKTIKEARVLAEGNHMEDARKKLNEARKVLEDSKPCSSIETMKHELEHLSGLMTSSEVYMKQGRSYLFSLESSHDRQRFALRGDVEKHRMFAIPHMDKHFAEVKSSVK